MFNFSEKQMLIYYQALLCAFAKKNKGKIEVAMKDFELFYSKGNETKFFFGQTADGKKIIFSIVDEDNQGDCKDQLALF